MRLNISSLDLHLDVAWRHSCSFGHNRRSVVSASFLFDKAALALRLSNSDSKHSHETRGLKNLCHQDRLIPMIGVSPIQGLITLALTLDLLLRPFRIA